MLDVPAQGIAEAQDEDVGLPPEAEIHHLHSAVRSPKSPRTHLSVRLRGGRLVTGGVRTDQYGQKGCLSDSQVQYGQMGRSCAVRPPSDPPNGRGHERTRGWGCTRNQYHALLGPSWVLVLRSSLVGAETIVVRMLL